MPERVFDGWADAYRHAPFGDEQLLLARVCALLLMSVQRQYGEQAYELMDKLTACFMPRDWAGRKAETVEIDLDSIKRSQEVLSKWQHP